MREAKAQDTLPEGIKDFVPNVHGGLSVGLKKKEIKFTTLLAVMRHAEKSKYKAISFYIDDKLLLTLRKDY